LFFSNYPEELFDAKCTKFKNFKELAEVQNAFLTVIAQQQEQQQQQQQQQQQSTQSAKRPNERPTFASESKGTKKSKFTDGPSKQ
jgi:hypothetical protein